VGENAVDILIRIRDTGTRRVDELVQKLQRGGPVARAFGGAAFQALTSVGYSAENAARLVSGVGTAAAAAGNKLNHWLGIGVSRLISLAKWAGLAAVGFAAWQIGKGIRFNEQIEQVGVGLAVMYRSQARANEEMKRTLEFSARTPFRFEELAETTRQLEAFGLAASEWRETAGNLAAATGRPIQEVAHALGYLASGRAGEAVQSLARMGVNLRAVRGIRFESGGAMATSGAEALRMLQAHVSERYGGMMERQARTFGGAVSTMLDNLAMLRAEIAKPLFERLRDKLNALNAVWEKFVQTARVQAFVRGLQSALTGAWAWLERLMARFDAALGRTGSLRAAIVEVARADVFPALRKGAVAFARLLGELIKEALVAAWKGFLGMSGAAIGAVGALAGLMMIPKVKAAGEFGGWLAALTDLKGLLGRTGEWKRAYGVGAAGVRVIQRHEGGAGMLGWMAGLAGPTATAAMKSFMVALVPVAVAATIAYMGARAIDAYGTKEATLERARYLAQGVEEGKGFSSWFFRWKTLERLPGYGLDMLRGVDTRHLLAGEEAEAESTRVMRGREKRRIDLLNDLTAAISRNLDAYQRIVAAQQAIRAAIDETTDAVDEMGEAFLEKFRSPEEEVKARQEAVQRLRDRYEELTAKFAPKGTGEERAAEMRRHAEERLNLIREIARAEYAVLEVEQKRREEIEKQNRTFAEQLALMKPEERGRLRVLRERIAAEPTAFERLSRESRELLLRHAPEASEVLERGGAFRRLLEEAGGGLKPPTAETAAEADARVRADAARRLADTFGLVRETGKMAEEAKKAVAEAVKAVGEKWGERSIRIEVATIDQMIKVDTTGMLSEALANAVREAENHTVQAVMDALRKELNAHTLGAP